MSIAQLDSEPTATITSLASMNAFPKELPPPQRIFLGSTWEDMRDERAEVEDVLNRSRQGMFVGMEYFPPSRANSEEASLSELDNCQIYLGVFGQRYGSGIAVREYERALQRGIPLCIYLREHQPGQPIDLEQELFRARLRRDHTITFFNGPSDLAKKVAIALQDLLSPKNLWAGGTAGEGPAQPFELSSLDSVALEGLIAQVSVELAHEQEMPLALARRSQAPGAGPEANWLFKLPLRVSRQNASEDGAPETLGEALSRSSPERLVLLGEPGAGKTSILKGLLLVEAEKLRRDEPKACLPILIPLIDYDGTRSLEAMILDAIQDQAPAAGKASHRAWLTEGRILLLLDGLNEVPRPVYTACRNEIQKLMRRFHRSSFVVTDRPTYDRFLPVDAVQLDDWGLEQISSYVAWALQKLGSSLPKEPLLELIQGDVRLRKLVSAPLPLGILTSVYSGGGNLSMNRANLYRAFVDRWARREGPAKDVPWEVKLRLLQILALELRSRGLTSAPSSLVLELCRGVLGERALATEHEILNSLVNGRWLFETAPGSYRFRFLPLQELFAAQELANRWEGGDPLADLVLDARFEEEMVLIAGLIEKPRPFLDQVLRLAGVQLAARCLISVPQAPGGEKIVRQLIRELSSPSQMRRRRAAGKFIYLRSFDAVPALLEALGDDSGAVRWNAAKAIETTHSKGASDEVFAQILANPRSSVPTRRTVCQALGRSSTDVAAKALLGALGSSSEDVWKVAGEALARGSQRSALELLERAARGETGEATVQARALWVISRHDPERVRALALELAAGGPPSVRKAARVALGRCGDPGVLAETIAALEEGGAKSPLPVIRDLGEMGPPARAAVSALWRILPGALREVRAEIFATLRSLGGEESFELATRDMESHDPAQRRIALSALGHLWQERAIPTLVRALRDPDPNTASTAAAQVGRFGDRALPELQGAIEKAEAGESTLWLLAVLRALQATGTRSALQGLASYLEDERSDVARQTLKLLEGADPQPVRILLRELKPEPPNPAARLWERLELQRLFWLALSVRGSRDSGLWRELVEAHDSDLETIRRCALLALGETRRPEAAHLLRQAMSDGPAHLRSTAIEALTHLGPDHLMAAEATFAAWAMEPEQPRDVRLASLNALALCAGEDRREALLALSGDADAAIAERAIFAFSGLVHRSGEGIPLLAPKPPSWKLELLEKALTVRLAREKRLAVEELASFAPGEGGALLLEALDDADAGIRRLAVASLGRQRETRAIPSITKALKDRDQEVRRAAIEALLRFDTAAALEALGEAGRDEPVLRELAFEGLSRAAGQPSAFGPLLRFLGDADLSQRAARLLAGFDPERLTSEQEAQVFRTLQPADPAICCSMLEVLAQWKPDRWSASVRRLARHFNLRIRRSALRALLPIATAEDLPTLTESLQSSAVDVIQEAVRILVRLESPESMVLLEQAADSLEVGVAGAVLAAIPKASPEAAGRLLSRLLRHPSPRVSLPALDAGGEATAPAITPAVLALLRHRSTLSVVRRQAIRCAGRLRIEEAARDLCDFIGSISTEVREAAIQALREIGTGTVVPLLAHHLRSSKPEVAGAAASLLGDSASAEAANQLGQALRELATPYQREAVRALFRLAQPASAIPLIRLAKATREHSLQLEIVAGLARLEGEEAEAFLLHAALTHGSDAAIRGAAEQAIERDGEWITTGKLKGLLRNPMPSVRAAGIRLLGARRAETAVRPLLELLAGDSPEVRSAAEQGLIRIESRICIEPLIQLLDRENRVLHLQQAACRILGALKAEEAVPALVRILQSPKAHPYTLQATAEALRRISSDTVASELFAALENPNPKVRATSVRAMGEMKVASSVGAIGDLLLRQDDVEVRKAAVTALAQIDTPESVERLGLAAFDPAPVIRRGALDLLARIPKGARTRGAAAGALRLLLDGGTDQERLQVVLALVENPHWRATEALLQSVHDPNPRIRDAALRSLGQREAIQHLPVLVDATHDATPAIRREAKAIVEKLRLTMVQKALKLVVQEEKKVPPGKYLFYWSKTRDKVLEILEVAELDWVAETALRAVAAGRPGNAGAHPAGLLLGPYLRLLGWTASHLRWEMGERLGQILLGALEHPQRRVRLAAILAIGDAGLRRAVPRIVALALDPLDPDPLEQQAAIRALVELYRQAPVPETITVVRELSAPGQTIETRYSAIRAFEEIRLQDDEARLVALEALGDPDARIQEAGVIALGHCGTGADIESLTAYLTNPGEALRRSTLKSLRKLDAHRVAREIVALLKDPSPLVVAAAAETCAALGLEEAVEALVDLALGERAEVRICAEEGLLALRSRLSVLYLQPFARDTRRAELKPALRLLTRLDLPEARQILRDALTRRGSEVRLEALRTLSAAGFAPAGGSSSANAGIRPYIPDLLAAFQDPDPEVRGEVVELVRTCAILPLFRPDLERLLEDPSARVRRSVARALGELGETTIEPFLFAALEREEDDSARQAIVRALVRLPSTSVAKTLHAWSVKTGAQARFLVVAARQDERMRVIVEETVLSSPQDRLDDPNPSLRCAAIRQIGRNRQVLFAPRLLPFLGAANPLLQRAAIESLGQLRVPSTLSSIERLAVSPDPWIRLKVAQALGDFGQVRSIPTLIQLFDEGQSGLVARAAGEALARIDDPKAARFLGEFLAGSTDARLARPVVAGMGEQGGPHWAEALSRGLASTQEAIRLAVVRRLGEIPYHSGSRAGLEAALGDPSPDVVREAVQVVGLQGARDLIPLVHQALRHPDNHVRSAAAKALGDLRATECAPCLIEATRDPERQVVSAAAFALGELVCEEAANALAELLQQDKALIFAAIEALGHLRGPEAAAALGRAMANPDAYIRHRAVAALCRLPASVALDYLLAGARDENHFVREAALPGLAQRDHEEAFAALCHALGDVNVFVRSAAVSALAELEPDDALPALGQALSDSNPHVRSRAASAIGRLSATEFDEELLELLQDPYPAVRGAAIWALAQRQESFWVKPVTDLAKLDPLPSVRDLAHRMLQRSKASEALLAVREIEREEEESRALLQEPHLLELKESLEGFQRTGINLDDPAKAKDLIRTLARAFSTKLPALRLAAAQLLVRFPSPEAFFLCEYAAQDPLPGVRERALRALLRTANPQAADYLVERFGAEPSTVVRSNLVAEMDLSADPEDSLRLLEKALADPSRFVVLVALRKVQAARLENTLALVGPLLDHPDDFVREASVVALSSSGAKDSLTRVWPLLADPSWYVRQDAVALLAQLGDPDLALRACRAGLADSSPRVRMTSVNALCAVRSSAALDLLLAQLDPIFHRHASLRSVAIQGVVRCIERRDEFAALGTDWAEVADKLLAAFVVEADFEARLGLIDALGLLDPSRSAVLVADCLFEGADPLRRRAISLCETALDSSAFEGLILRFEAALETLPVGVRRDLSYLFRRVAPGALARLLPRLINDGDEFVRVNAVLASGKAGDSSSLGPLRRALEDPARNVRQLAELMLKKRAERDLSLPRAAAENPTRETAPPPGAGSNGKEAEAFEEKILSQHWLERWYAVMTATSSLTPRTVETLIHMFLEDENGTVRSEAFQVLASGPSTVVRKVIECCAKEWPKAVAPDRLRKLAPLLEEPPALQGSPLPTTEGLQQIDPGSPST